MILLHESLPAEATRVAEIVHDVLAIKCELRDERRDDLFPPLPDPAWAGSDGSDVMDRMQAAFPRQPTFFLTPRDLFDYAPGRSPDDYWMFGLTRSRCSLCLVSTARLHGTDSSPQSTTRASAEQYMRRLSLLAVHEIGHVLTAAAPHHAEAAWVNALTGARDVLGRHCDDPACVMYPTVDLGAPSPDRGCMEFEAAGIKRFDAGLDDQIQRLRADWFCLRCRTAIRVPDAFKRPG